MSETITRERGPSFFTRLIRSGRRGLAGLYHRTPLYRWRLGGDAPERPAFHLTPPKLAETSRAKSILAGELLCAGETVSLSGKGAEKEIAATAPAFQQWFYGFGWLADLASLETGMGGEADDLSGAAQAVARLYLKAAAGWTRPAMQPETAALRLIHLALYSDLLFASADVTYRMKLMQDAGRSLRHLAHTAHLADGAGAILAAAGLAIGAAHLDMKSAYRKKGLRLLEGALSLVASDGGLPSRNPRDMAQSLWALALAAEALDKAEVPKPAALQTGIDRLAPAVRALTAGDMRLAQFHGSYERDFALAEGNIARFAGYRGAIPGRLSRTGYQRLEHESAIILVDSAPPPARAWSRLGHASALSFEFYDGPDRIVVNQGGSLAGAGGKAAGQSEASRGTEAHSTLQVGARASVIFGLGGHIHGGLSAVEVDRRENRDGIWLDMSHDGYAGRCGLRHRRRLYLGTRGDDFRGHDQLLPGRKFFGRRARKRELVRIAFHLHPHVQASFTREGAAIIVRTRRGHGWMFRFRGAAASLEDGYYWPAPDIARHARAIVLKTGLEGEGCDVKWSFQRMKSHN